MSREVVGAVYGYDYLRKRKMNSRIEGHGKNPVLDVKAMER